MNVALILALAACEHAQSIHAPAPTPAPPPPPSEPVVESTPAVAPKPPQPALEKKCNPMSRAGCRWDEERDEREVRRVTKKPPVETP